MTMQKLAIIYDRGDNDGILSYQLLRGNFESAYDIVPIPYRYGDDVELIWQTLDDPMIKSVYMADISLPPVHMKRLHEKYAGLFVWIDHHASAIEANLMYKGLQRIDHSAAMLCWMYLNGGPRYEAPRAIQLVERYDIFKDSEAEDFYTDVIPFEMALTTKRLMCGDDVLRDLASCDDQQIDAIITQGRHMREYEESLIRPVINHTAHDLAERDFEPGYMGYGRWILDIEGQRVLVMKQSINAGRQAYYIRKCNMELDVLMTFNYKGNDIWTYSLRALSERGNCLRLIEDLQLRGGGHVAAAGASSINFIIENA